MSLGSTSWEGVPCGGKNVLRHREENMNLARGVRNVMWLVTRAREVTVRNKGRSETEGTL